MKGLIPDEVLAPRVYRTGVTGGYFARSMVASFGPLLLGALEGSVLAELRIIDPDAVRRSLDAYLRSPLRRASQGSMLYQVWQAELWVRGRYSALRL